MSLLYNVYLQIPPSSPFTQIGRTFSSVTLTRTGCKIPSNGWGAIFDHLIFQHKMKILTKYFWVHYLRSLSIMYTNDYTQLSKIPRNLPWSTWKLLFYLYFGRFLGYFNLCSGILLIIIKTCLYIIVIKSDQELEHEFVLQNFIDN